MDSGNSLTEGKLKEDLNNLQPMKRKKPCLLIFVLIAIILFIAFGAYSSYKRKESSARMSGNAEYDGVQISIDQKVSGIIKLSVQNQTSKDFNMGWVDDSTIILNTSAGSYVRKARRTIGDHSSGVVILVFNDAVGIPLDAEIQGVGTGLGARNDVSMNIKIDGYGEKELVKQTVPEIAWGYICWAYYWFMDASDMQGIILRVFIGIFALVILLSILGLLLPRNTVRAKVVKKYIETVTHYHNNMPTGTSYNYIVVFMLENGKKRKIDVRSQGEYDKIDSIGWGLLTVKGSIFVRFEYLPTMT